jgi:PAS domain S-box-containing protein
VLNILEDFNVEKARLESTQRAVLNILDDFNLEKARLEETQRATFNILEDFNVEKTKVEKTSEGLKKEVAERKRAEEAVKESEQRLTLALDSAQMGAWELNLTNDTAIRSLKHDQIFGYPSLQPEWGSEIFLAHVVPEDRDLVKKRFEEAFATSHFNMECRIMWPDQSLHWIAAQGRVYRNHKGEPVRMMGVVTDIAERKRAEEERDRFFALSLDMLCIAKSDGYFKRVSPAFTKTLGWSTDEMLARPFLDFVHPDDHVATLREVERQVAGGEPVLEFENRYQHKDGSWRVLSWKSVPQPDGLMYAIARDITEHKRAEAATAQLAAIVESSDDAIVSTDLNSIIATWNQGAERLFGYTADEIVDWPVTRLIPPDRLHEEAKLMEGILHGIRTQHFDTVRLRKDGTPLEVSVTVSPIKGAGDCTVGASKIIRDITERKSAEQALRLAHAELERRVEERTAELSKRTRDLETLLYVTSHDLREPLRSIENFSRMVHDRYADHLDDKGKDFLRRVVRGAQRMDRLMTDILALSRAQRMDLPTEEVEGERIVEEALRRLGDKIKETGATVRVAKNLPRFRANSTWATQGVYNLLTNALKFARPNEAPDIEIAPYHPNGTESAEVGLIVRDHGPGVAPEHAERIFQLFQRAVGREIEGTGAGLAIVRQVAERHGGRAWVQPREGGGAEFILTFGATNRQKGSDVHDESAS